MFLPRGRRQWHRLLVGARGSASRSVTGGKGSHRLKACAASTAVLVLLVLWAGETRLPAQLTAGSVVGTQITSGIPLDDLYAAQLRDSAE